MYGEHDDWLYESIKCYGRLSMFEMELKPTKMILIDDKHICFAGQSYLSNNYEIMSLALPAKLLMSADKEGLSKANDFDIAYSSSKFHKGILDIGHGSEEEIIVTFVDGKDIFLISLDDKLKAPEKLFCSSYETTPNFTISQHDRHLIASGSIEEPLTLVDLGEKTIKASWNIPSTPFQNNEEITLRHNAENLVYLLGTSTGTVMALDLRERDKFTHVRESTALSEYVMNASEKKIALLSSCGECSVYDTRVRGKPLAQTKFNIETSDSSRLRIELATKDRISVSGFDGTVTVYEIKDGGLETIFTHKAHEQLRSEEETFVTDHMWLPHISENFLISCSNDGTLTCWEYRDT